jgi:hypothetical protein
MTATTSNNRPQRKQLSEQLDRLDSMLDGLSDGLNSAVAEATREGTRLALKDALVEIMTDPALRAKLHQATGPEPVDESASAKPGILERATGGMRRMSEAICRGTAKLMESGRAQAKSLARTASEGVKAARALGSLKNLALVGIGVGVTVGVVALVAPHAVAAGLSGLCGGTAAVAVQLGRWTRRTLGALAAA